MTLKEILYYIEAYNTKREVELKQSAIDSYNLASLFSSFIGCALSGKKIPSLSDCYPDFFPKQENEDIWMLWKEQLIDYANLHNKNKRKEK